MRLQKTLLLALMLFTFFGASSQSNWFEDEIISMFEGERKDIWIHHYKGHINNIHEVNLSLGYDGIDYKGIYQYQSSGAYFFLEGTMSDKGLLLQEINQDDYTTGYLVLNKDNRILSGKWMNAGKEIILNALFEMVIGGEQQKAIQASDREGHYEYADFDIRIEWTYPDIDNKSYKDWLNAMSISWKRQSINEIQRMKKADPGLMTTDRFKYEALAWTETSCSNEDLVSGIFYFQNSWSGKIDVRPFCFNLIKGKEVEIKSLFKEEIVQSKIYKDYILKKVKELKNDEIHKQWIKEDSFKYLTLGEEGLIVSTAFNTIFGSQNLVIPYSELKDISRKSGLLKRWIK